MRWRKSVLVIFVVMIVCGSGLYAVYRDKTDPPRFSTEDFEGLTERDALQKIAEATVIGGAPGVVLHIRRGDDAITVSAGFANKASAAPMPRQAALRIGSITKIYMAVIIHHLIEAEKFSLDTPIRTLLPADMIRDVPNAAEVTVRQLLQHTSGIPDYYDMRSYLFTDWRNPITLEGILPTVRRQKPTNAPGEKYHYSNTGYMLLGEIAQLQSGKNLETLFRDVIFAPLGLTATYYSQFAPEGDTIHGYGTYLRPWKDTYEYWEHSGADGGMMARASEVAIFLDAVFSNDGVLAAYGRQITSEIIDAQTRRRQGLGVETVISRSGEEIFGHTGSIFGYQSIAYYFPQRDIVIIGHLNCECQRLTSSVMANLFRAVVAIDGDTSP